MLKKMLNKLIAVGLVGCMFLTLSGTANAAKDLSREDKIKKLVKSGILNEYLQDISDLAINELLKDKGEFVSVKTVSYTFDKDTNQIKEVKNDGISTMSLSSADFTQTTYVQRIYEKAGDNFKFVAYGRWNKNPIWTLTDTAAMAWSDGFAMYSDSCTYELFRFSGWITKSCPRNSVNPAAGVSHEIDIEAGYSDAGRYTQVAKVNCADASRTGSANLMAQYSHVVLNIGAPTATFAGSIDGCSIQFSASWGVDNSQPAYSYFEY